MERLSLVNRKWVRGTLPHSIFCKGYDVAQLQTAFWIVVVLTPNTFASKQIEEHVQNVPFISI